MEGAIDELESDGEISADRIYRLVHLFGEEPDSPILKLRAWFYEETPDEDEGDLESDLESRRPWTETNQVAALEHLKMMLQDLDRQGREAHKQENTDLEIERQRLSIPRGREFECIQRYEIGIKRELLRALNQLENLQRRRRGEPSLPTANVNVSNDNSE